MKRFPFFEKKFFYLLAGIFFISFQLAAHSKEPQRPFFQASHAQPYHLSVGAVLFNQDGRVACHKFEKIFGIVKLYILMRETVENGETLLDAMHRGLMEEFGATATPIAFLGCLSGDLPSQTLPFEKTTLYVACQLNKWDPALRDPNDPEAGSAIEWHDPAYLIRVMKNQGTKYRRVDVDESEMIRRAIPYMKKAKKLAL